jgi:hypothetical protein
MASLMICHIICAQHPGLMLSLTHDTIMCCNRLSAIGVLDLVGRTDRFEYMMCNIMCLFVCALVRTWTGTGHRCFTVPVCLCISPDFDGYQGTKNETLTPRDPKQVSKPKYEDTALQARPNIGYESSYHQTWSLYISLTLFHFRHWENCFLFFKRQKEPRLSHWETLRVACAAPIVCRQADSLHAD